MCTLVNAPLRPLAPPRSILLRASASQPRARSHWPAFVVSVKWTALRLAAAAPSSRGRKVFLLVGSRQRRTQTDRAARGTPTQHTGARAQVSPARIFNPLLLLLLLLPASSARTRRPVITVWRWTPFVPTKRRAAKRQQPGGRPVEILSDNSICVDVQARALFFIFCILFFLFCWGGTIAAYLFTLLRCKSSTLQPLLLKETSEVSVAFIISATSHRESSLASCVAPQNASGDI